MEGGGSGEGGGGGGRRGKEILTKLHRASSVVPRIIAASIAGYIRIEPTNG